MIEIESCGDSELILRPIGDLDIVSSFHYRHVVDDILRPSLDLTIDLGDVGSVDSFGLSALVGTIRRVASVGGIASIRNAPPRIDSFLHRFSIDRLRKIYEEPQPRPAA